jgi:preprotein translocase subunit SecG
MGILGVALLVIFVIVAILLILLVLIQDEEGDGLGGIFAGGSGSAFGSRSGNVLTRTTSILGALFLVISIGLALIHRSPVGRGVEEAGRALSGEGGVEWFLDDETPPVIYPDAINPDAIEGEAD